MPHMRFDLEDGGPKVCFDLKDSDAERFSSFMRECTDALEDATRLREQLERERSKVAEWQRAYAYVTDILPIGPTHVRDPSSPANMAEQDRHAVDLLIGERDALQARVDELGRQEPVAFVEWNDGMRQWAGFYRHDLVPGTKLYAAPVPAAVPDASRDAYEGAREDLLEWKGRALRAEQRLRAVGWHGEDASQPPTDAQMLAGAQVIYRRLHVAPTIDEMRSVLAAIGAYRLAATVPASDAKDAARYRQLRPVEDDEVGSYGGGYPNPGVPVVHVVRLINGKRELQSVSGSELDAILDAAMGDEGNG